VRPLNLLILALALSACRATPAKRSPKPGGSVSSTPAPAAEVPSSSSSPAAFIDAGFPNEDQPELVTARRLFPSAFGFDDGPPREEVKHLLLLSGHLLEGLANPPPHCLNSIAQPPVADLVLRLLASSNADEKQRRFSVNEAIVLKDRSRHYVIAVPKGAEGVLMLPPDAPSYGIHDADPTDERFSLVLSDVTIIYPDGHALRLPPGDNRYTGGAILTVTDRLRVRLCANDPRYKAKGCPKSDPRVRIADVPPRDFDLRRCEPGCNSLCSRAEVHEYECPAPASKCIGDRQRIFLDGRDAGGYCVFEEWDIQCEGGCREDKCVGAPQLSWTRKMSPGFRAVVLDEQTMATTEGEGDDLVTLSVAGEILRKEKSPQGELAAFASDEHGRLFTLDRSNAVLRSRGEGPWSLELEKSDPTFQTWLRYHSGKLYLTRGTKVTCLNAATGQEEWRVDLGAEARSDVVLSDTSLAVTTVDREVVVIGLDGSLRGRTKLPADVLEKFSMDGENLTIYVETGEVLSGRFDAMKAIALIPQAEWRPGGVAAFRKGAVLLNRGTDHLGNTRIHALDVPSGRELWRYAVRGELRWGPSIDSRGNVLLVGQTITSLTPNGKQRFQIDLRGGPQSEAVATLGPDGASFYVRTPRALTKFSGL